MTDHQTRLRRLFSETRGEWPPSEWGSLFVEPPYLGDLVADGPAVLIGGRGTGKTTALRSLRFDATGDSDSIDSARYLGFYLRINKNRVRAFRGAGLPQETWQAAFAHYFNVAACIELSELAAWLIRQAGGSESIPDVGRVARCFGLESLSVEDLGDRLRAELSSLERWVNNPGRLEAPIFSVAEAPLREFGLALKSAGALNGRTLFCCVDEYENLENWQQSVLNTYVKHAEPPLSYKIGVRKHGLRSRETIDTNDLLANPDDYREIDISFYDFEPFAQKVVERRLALTASHGVPVATTLDKFLPALTLEEEGKRLGSESVAARAIEAVRAEDDSLATWLSQQPKLEVAMMASWARGHPNKSLVETVEDARGNRHWDTHVGNYSYASLFWLSKGRKGARTRKFYTGKSTLLLMASGNIRYVLELLHEGVRLELSEDREWSGDFCVSADSQTEAAKLVGERRLQQILGLSDRGAELRRIMLALGRIFFEFARDPSKAPEITSFLLKGSADDQGTLVSLLKEGVSHLAFEAYPSTKATTPSESREDEYRIHPIYSAFFEISHRKKRHAIFDAGDVLLVLTQTRQAIEKLLGKPQEKEEELPTQLAMFSEFFAGGGEDG